MGTLPTEKTTDHLKDFCITKQTLPAPFLRKNKRGRPKKNNTTFDYGTTQLQQKKRKLLGSQQEVFDYEVSKTLYLLFCRKAISRTQCQAGKRYKFLWENIQRILGVSYAKQSLLWDCGLKIDTKGTASAFSSAHNENVFFIWRDVQDLFFQHAPRLQKEVHRIIVDDFILPSMIQEDHALFPCASLLYLQKGLSLLDCYFKKAPLPSFLRVV